EEVLDRGAVAAMAPRSVRGRSRPGDAYLTIGAGSRAIGDPDVDGQVLDPAQSFSGEVAGGVFARRTGRDAHGEAVALAWPRLLRLNADEPYDVVLGLLADTLAAE